VARVHAEPSSGGLSRSVLFESRVAYTAVLRSRVHPQFHHAARQCIGWRRRCGDRNIIMRRSVCLFARRAKPKAAIDNLHGDAR
jgi:hypothetical protein